MRQQREIVVGGTYQHIHGGSYRVDRLVPDATGYERRKKVGSAVEYTQLHDGKYPAGTVWVRSERDFLSSRRQFPHLLTRIPVFILEQKRVVRNLVDKTI